MNKPAKLNDVQLSKSLGTDRKSLRRWRFKFSSEAPTENDPVQWRAFMEANLLGPWSAQRGFGDGVQASAQPATPSTRIPDTENQSFLRMKYVDATMLGGALGGRAEDYFPGHVKEARRKLREISALWESLYDLAGLVEFAED